MTAGLANAPLPKTGCGRRVANVLSGWGKIGRPLFGMECPGRDIPWVGNDCASCPVILPS